MRAHDDRDLPCCRTGARLASRAASWRAEFAPCGCEQVISSSPRALAGEVEESVAKEQDYRQRERDARGRHASGRAGLGALAFVFFGQYGPSSSFLCKLARGPRSVWSMLWWLLKESCENIEM